MSSSMATTFLEFIRSRFNRRTIAFLACVILSGLFWLLTSLSKEYVDKIEMPIQYVNLPADLVITNDLPNHAMAEVRGFGFDLLWHRFKLERLNLTVSVNPAKLKRINKNGVELRYLLTGNRSGGLTSIYNDRLDILGVVPDTLFFQFKKRHSKMVPVELKADITFAKQFGMVVDPILVPDSILITGPKVELDRISSVFTEAQSWKELNENVDSEINLKLPQNPTAVTYSHSVVHLDLNVVEFTEGSVKVPLDVLTRNRINVQVFPSEVEVKFLVPLSEYDQVRASDFSTSVTLDQQTEKNSLLVVSIDKYPPVVSSVRTVPAQVEFIIQK